MAWWYVDCSGVGEECCASSKCEAADHLTVSEDQPLRSRPHHNALDKTRTGFLSTPRLLSSNSTNSLPRDIRAGGALRHGSGMSSLYFIRLVEGRWLRTSAKNKSKVDEEEERDQVPYQLTAESIQATRSQSVQLNETPDNLQSRQEGSRLRASAACSRCEACVDAEDSV